MCVENSAAHYTRNQDLAISQTVYITTQWTCVESMKVGQTVVSEEENDNLEQWIK